MKSHIQLRIDNIVKILNEQGKKHGDFCVKEAFNIYCKDNDLETSYNED